MCRQPIKKKFFCFGLGYTASYLTDSLEKLNFEVFGTNRVNKNSYIFNEIERFPKELLNNVTHLLSSIPPGTNGDPAFNYYRDFIRNLPNLEWVGYFSATNVYGDHQGKWVNETSSLNATDYNSINRINAEKQWSNFLQSHIFRLSGIYGKGRSILDTIRTKPLIDKQDHYFSRIHVEDIANIILKSIESPHPGIYNVADDLPETSLNVGLYACKLLNIDPPKIIAYEDAMLSDRMREFYSNNKKVDNHKIKEIFNVQLKYPTYQEGLIAINQA